jgi:hypothetical protein
MLPPTLVPASVPGGPCQTVALQGLLWLLWLVCSFLGFINTWRARITEHPVHPVLAPKYSHLEAQTKSSLYQPIIQAIHPSHIKRLLELLQLLCNPQNLLPPWPPIRRENRRSAITSKRLIAHMVCTFHYSSFLTIYSASSS